MTPDGQSWRQHRSLPSWLQIVRRDGHGVEATTRRRGTRVPCGAWRQQVHVEPVFVWRSRAEGRVPDASPCALIELEAEGAAVVDVHVHVKVRTTARLRRVNVRVARPRADVGVHAARRRRDGHGVEATTRRRGDLCGCLSRRVGPDRDDGRTQRESLPHRIGPPRTRQTRGTHARAYSLVGCHRSAPRCYTSSRRVEQDRANRKRRAVHRKTEKRYLAELKARAARATSCPIVAALVGRLHERRALRHLTRGP